MKLMGYIDSLQSEPTPIPVVEEEIKAAEEEIEKELQEVNALVNDIKEQGIQEVVATVENIEIKIKPPKGCCVIQ